MRADPAAQIDRYVEFLEEVAPPVTFGEIVGDGVVQPLHRRPSKKAPGRWVWAVAAAVVVLLFVGGALWLVEDRDDGSSVTTEPPPDETSAPTTQDAPSNTTDEAPSDLSGDSGTVDTPLGPIPWVHATEISPSMVPHDAIQTPGGFAGVALLEVSDGRFGSVWLTSPDGADWTEAPFPVPLEPRAEVSVGEAGGRFWLTDGSRLWLSGDAQAWTEVDLSGITPPPSAGVVWALALEPPAARGDLIVFPLRLRPELPLREIFDPGADFSGGVRRTNCGWSWELEACQDVDDVDDVVFGVDLETGEETLLARFRIETEGGTAHVVDIDTGDRVHEFSIAGLDDEQLTGIPGSNIDWNALLLVNSEPAGTVVDVPWSSFDLRGLFLTVFDDRFVAHVDTDPPHGPATLDAIEVWESVDARTWTRRGPVDFGIDASGEVDIRWFQEGDGRAVALVSVLEGVEGEALPTEWRLISTDGSNWEPYVPDAAGFAVRVEGGFVSFDDGVSLSEDGTRWEELISFEPPVGDLAFIVGDTLVVAHRAQGVGEVWAFDLEP